MRVHQTGAKHPKKKISVDKMEKSVDRMLKCDSKLAKLVSKVLTSFWNSLSLSIKSFY